MILTINGTAISVATQAETAAKVAMPIGHAALKCAGDLVFFAAYGAAKCLDYITTHMELVDDSAGRFSDIKIHLLAPLLTGVFL